ncbi:MAG: TIR domain-containing protein [Limimaricola sp.]|uniref:TIR domain-containing protein n=1 Tax=Limimaricola sp. TaxID=2211665 RepID=UPI001D5989F5|nr:TIR domain-containing protein [Limimaricola sp.]MBI1415764.1 TIR domain-containing protein [Limimaricola sp.]
MKIFASHSSTQKLFVREFLSLCPSSIDFWVDEKSINAGDDILTKIDEALSGDLDFVALFVEEHSARSSWVAYEVSRALEREKELGRPILIPIVLSEVGWNSLRDVLGPNRKYIKCFDQLDDSIRMAAARFTESIFDWLISKTNGEKRDKDAPATGKLKDAEAVFKKLAAVLKSEIHAFRRQNPITVEELLEKLNASRPGLFSGVEELNHAISELFGKGYMSGYYYDGEIIFLAYEKFFQKREVEDSVKAKIARIAVSLLEDDMKVAIDGGSTTYAAAEEVAKLITAGAISGLEIFTNSIPVAGVILNALNDLNLGDRDSTCTVTMMGGKCRHNSMCTLLEENSAIGFTEAFPGLGGGVDISFMGTSGITENKGFGITHRFELPAKTGFCRAARQVIVLCDKSKFETNQPRMFAEFSERITVITERASEPSVDRLRASSESFGHMKVVYCD